MVDLRGRDFLKLLDFTPAEINHLLKVATTLKKQKHNHESHMYLKGKQIAMIFEKDSTRTRCSFEAGAVDLGMSATYIGPTGSQLGKKETVADTARVLTRIYDGIEYRGFDQKIVEELAANAGVPVWNGLTTEFHPTQMLADVMTIEENFGNCKGLKMVFMGDARNNVANSLMVVSAKLGINFVACGPKENMPNTELVETCQKIAKENNCTITLSDNVEESTKDADVIYTDIWVSMGEDKSIWEKRIKLLSPYQVNSKVMSNAKEYAILILNLSSYMFTGICPWPQVYTLLFVPERHK